MIAVELPIPPSLNNAYPTINGRRVKSERLRTWIRAAGNELLAARQRPVPGLIEVTLSLPWQMRGDVSNRVKAVEDLLAEHRLIDDDRFVVALHVVRHPALGLRRCHVEVRSAERASA